MSITKNEPKTQLASTLEQKLIPYIPIAIGLTLGTIARLTDSPEIIAVPFVMDLIGGIPIYDLKSLINYNTNLAKYLAASAIPHADQIIQRYNLLEHLL